MNILDTRFIDAVDPDGCADTLTRPGVLAGICDGTVAEIPGLRYHQVAAFHVFLAQLAAGTVCRVCDGILPESEAAWRKALLKITDNNPDPWDLIPKTENCVGFMQPKTGGKVTEDTKIITSPQQLDILVASKNHAIKSQLLRNGTLQDWFFAILSRQTFGAYDGRNNQGVARMNGSYGSRPFWSLTMGDTFGEHVLRDINVLIAERTSISRGEKPDAILGNFDMNGPFLLWTMPWDDDSLIDPFTCDPFFIEISHRLRISGTANGITVQDPGSAKRRVANDTKGVLGDPWSPIVVKGDGYVGLSMTSEGPVADLICKVMLGVDGKYRAPLCAIPQPSETGLRLVISCLVGGQGKTGGYHEREVPIPDTIIRLMTLPDEQEVAARMAQEMLLEDKQACDAVKSAMKVFLNKGEMPNGKFEKAAANTARSDLASAVDRDFFVRLSRRENPDLKKVDLQRLCALAERVLEEGFRKTPMTGVTRMRSETFARDELRRKLYSPRGAIMKSCPEIRSRESNVKRNTS